MVILNNQLNIKVINNFIQTFNVKSREYIDDTILFVAFNLIHRTWASRCKSKRFHNIIRLQDYITILTVKYITPAKHKVVH